MDVEVLKVLLDFCIQAPLEKYDDVKLESFFSGYLHFLQKKCHDCICLFRDKNNFGSLV
jgi:hypothetical protein